MRLLEDVADELAAFERVTIVHSTASLPEAGLKLSRRLCGACLHFVELFGSTETGLVATRELVDGSEDAWRLANDVEFADQEEHPGEAFLRIRSPRIARPSGGRRPEVWQLDDFVRKTTPRTFRFEGRRAHIVKINGQRVNLERVEESLRRVLPCRDLACVPVRDDVRGENFELLLVPHTRDIHAEEIRARCSEVLPKYFRPKRICVVDEIARGPMGKPRYMEGVAS